MKKIFVIIVLLVVICTVATCAFSKMGEVSAPADSQNASGEVLLAGKNAKELYYAAIDYIKGLVNYEAVLEGTYRYVYYDETDAEGESKETQEPYVEEQKYTNVYKAADDTIFYSYKDSVNEEHFIYDGTTLYQFLNRVKEQSTITYSDFIEKYGSFTQSGVLLELEDSSFAGVQFFLDDDRYALHFEMTAEEYSNLVGGGAVEGDVDYTVYFDADGVILGFSRSLEYYYYETILVQDRLTVTLKNIGTTEKITAPENKDDYARRPLAEEIDTNPVESLDGFEDSSEITNYVLFKFKVEPLKSNDEKETDSSTETDASTETKEATEAVDVAEIDEADAATEAETGSETEAESKPVEPFEGSILIRLYPEVAPMTVLNFQNYVGSATYKGMVINGIINDFALQIGRPATEEDEELDEGVFEGIFGEFSANGFTNNLTHKRGVLSMLRGEDPDSATYDFFICTKDVSGQDYGLDGNFATFGCVVYGFDVLEKIAQIDIDENYVPKATITITDTIFLAEKAE